ncbi:MAG: S9 family peptidase [Acidobacteriota bacterium]
MSVSSSRPPRPPRRPTTRRLHGTEWTDPYAWLSRRDAPEVLDHLRAENAWADAVLADTEADQDALYDEMVSRIAEDDISVPARRDGWLYYRRLEKGQQYPIHCRRRAPIDADSEPGPEEILLDVDRLAAGRPHLVIASVVPSPDHRLLAYSLDGDGSERFELRVLDLETGEHLPDRVLDLAAGLVWGADSATLYYLTRDATQRPYRVHRHRLGTDPAADELLFEEPDGRFFSSIRATRSRAYIVLELGTHSTSELHVLDAAEPAGRFHCVFPRRDGIEAELVHYAGTDEPFDVGWFFVRTNLGAPDFRVLEVSVDQVGPDADPSTWGECFPERSGSVLEGLAAFRRHLVLVRRRDGVRELEVLSVETDASHTVEFDETLHAVALGDNFEYDTETLRFTDSSLIRPRVVVDYDMDSRQRVVRKRQPVPGHDPETLIAERLRASGPDSVEIPISVVRRRDVPLDGSAPLLLYGYGSYGVSVEPRFSVSRLSLLDRGVIYAIAHVRGGGELGRAWYEAAKLQHKSRSFDDFAVVADRLIELGYTSPRRLVIRGGSAGGLLVGAAVTRWPERFHAAIADVPFVDVLQTMLDPSMPLTVIEFDEWGNPLDDAAAFETIRGYSPYENVEARGYPHLLVTAGLHDPRVQFWEPAKWVARMRAAKQDENWLLLRTDMESGHVGPSGRYDALRREAFKQAFLLAALDRDRSDHAGSLDALAPNADAGRTVRPAVDGGEDDEV